MAAKSHCRGWSIVFIDENWVYVDDLMPLDEKRPCIRCGLPPTAEGYDACLGYIPDITSACCGHGVKEII